MVLWVPVRESLLAFHGFKVMSFKRGPGKCSRVLRSPATGRLLVQWLQLAENEVPAQSQERQKINKKMQHWERCCGGKHARYRGVLVLLLLSAREGYPEKEGVGARVSYRGSLGVLGRMGVSIGGANRTGWCGANEKGGPGGKWPDFGINWADYDGSIGDFEQTHRTSRKCNHT